MPQQYALEEVFEMAMQLERNGEAFYIAAAKHARQDATKKLLLEMADWERRHEKLFQQMADSIDEDDRTEYVDHAGEAVAYVQSLVHGKVFQLHDEAMQSLAGQATMMMIFEMAIAMEKEAILFYLGVREMVPKGHDKIDEIIAEEMRHVRILSEQSPMD